jgi:dephospho-CoA kinase
MDDQAQEGDPRPILLGLTGGMGTGKTTLGRLLSRSRGWPLVDADALGHEALQPGTDVAARVEKRFGSGILRTDGSIDRGRLGRVVFGNERALRDLNSLTHPWILKRIAEEVLALRSKDHADIILLDAAVLNLWLKSLREGRRLWVVLVAAPLFARLARVKQRGLSTHDALARMRRQETTVGLSPRSCWTVVNGGSLGDLEAAAEDLAGRIEAARECSITIGGSDESRT